jgi:DNA-binding response OmpR family regulator
MKIVIIEDNTELLYDIKDFPEHEGHICEVAPDYQSTYMKNAIPS